MFYGLAGLLLAIFGFGWFKLSQALGTAAEPMRKIGRMLGNGLARFWGIFPFPVAEVVWVGGIAAALVITGILIRRRGFWGLGSALCWAALTGGIIFALFSVIFLGQYSAPPLADVLGLPAGKYSAQELADVAAQVAAELNESADRVGRDENGLFQPGEYTRLAEEVRDSYQSGSMADLYSCGAGVLPKEGVLLSKAMSYLGITGYYFPITGESVVSGDLYPTTVPFTIAHEAAHAFGVGPEKEANFAAFLCCVQSDSEDLRYAGLFNGYIYLNNALFSADRDLWREVYSTLSQPVRDDLAAKSAHLDQYEGKINDFGSGVNNAYIQSTGQPEGIRSYGLMVDLLISYYQSR